MPLRRVSSMMPAARSASMDICLPGSASRVNRAATSEMRPEPLRDDGEVDHHEDQEDDGADDEAPAHRELAEGLDEVPGRWRAIAAVEEDQTRGGHVEAQPEEGHDEQQRGKDREVERPREGEGHREDQQPNADAQREQDVERERPAAAR